MKPHLLPFLTVDLVAMGVIYMGKRENRSTCAYGRKNGYAFL